MRGNFTNNNNLNSNQRTLPKISNRNVKIKEILIHLYVPKT